LEANRFLGSPTQCGSHGKRDTYGIGRVDPRL
jgi:hypothetical protein